MQIGEVAEEQSKVIRAELDDVTPRTVFIVDRDHPGADAFALASAALAAASMALRRAGGHLFLVEQCLARAQGMYAVAQNMKATYSDSLEESAKTAYKADTWQTYLFFDAAWLLRATGDAEYRKVCIQVPVPVMSKRSYASIQCEVGTWQRAFGYLYSVPSAWCLHICPVVCPAV